jgi:hypothetical protein
MTEFFKALGLGGQKTEEKEVADALRTLDRRKTPLLMEVEQSHVHFRSVLAIKKGVVVVAKPGGIGGNLKKDAFIRYSLPDEPGKDIRMQVLSPHFNLTSGNAVFICKMPTAFAEGTKRVATRFNTSRFNNLHLVLPDQTEQFRIIDLSINGVKVFAQGKIEHTFPIGRTISPVRIIISKFSSELDGVIPRVHKGNQVGCEILIRENSPARKYIDHLIKSLQKQEEESLQASEI